MAGFLLGRDAEGQIIGQIRELIGEQGVTAIEATIRSARMLRTERLDVRCLWHPSSTLQE